MRQLALACLVLLLAATPGCRKKPATNAGTMDDTTAMAPAPAAEPVTPAAPPEFTFDRRQDFTAGVRQQLATIDRQIKELAAQAKSRGGAVSDHALANIRASRRSVDRNLQRVGSATAANWEDIRRGVNQAVDNLREAIEAAQPK